MFGKALRQIASSDAVYLSFDDGPDPSLTPQVLEVLKRYNAHATFFVVAKKAQKHPALIEKILSEGHSIGNHSLDHSYGVFFKGYQKMFEWIVAAEEVLKFQNVQSVGFRPPVGIRTPELANVLEKLEIPLILWNQRCYDGILPFSEKKAQKMARATCAGDILLLHDVQSKKHEDAFLKSLDTLICDLKAKNLNLKALQPKALKTTTPTS